MKGDKPEFDSIGRKLLKPIFWLIEQDGGNPEDVAIVIIIFVAILALIGVFIYFIFI